jgi:RimJ/RimL family protein N-acetyltransferase
MIRRRTAVPLVLNEALTPATKSRVRGVRRWPTVGVVPSSSHDLRLVPLSVETMRALVAGDLDAASAQTGITATPYLVDHAWLWRIRLPQVAEDPAALDWIARAAVTPSGEVVGLVGFHGPPDDRGMVEVAYGVDPEFRRQGYARSLLAIALEWAASVPAVTVVRASISPDNEASLATLRPFGFTEVGEQWDEEDGLELLFERPVR